jgi:hypothetical protein
MHLRAFALAMLLSLSTPAAAAAAPSEVHECVAASEKGQRLRDKLQLKDAREQFLACARESCPGIVRTECSKWLADANDRLPNVVVRATDGAGHDVVDVKVFVDDALAQEKVDGRRLELDPGPHKLRFERAGIAPKSVDIVAREGEKNRLVDVVLGDATAATPPTPPPKETPHESSFPVVGAVLAGIAVLGGVGFAVLAASGQSDVDHLRSTCAPRCASSDVSSARTKIILANVSLGVGIVALAGAGYFFFLAPSASPSSAGATATLRF